MMLPELQRRRAMQSLVRILGRRLAAPPARKEAANETR
jgi:hypothetical protein